MTTLVQNQSVNSYDPSDSISSSVNVDKVVQSVTNATKRLSQISTNTNNSAKKRKTQNKIGPWKLGRTLGRGSTGRVRLAKNIVSSKLAAVKIVPKSNFKMLENPKYKHPPTPTNKDRLPYGIEREIIIMKLISHPNIMGLYDVWENKNDLYLILEYIEGGELFDYLIKQGRLQEFEAINYFKQIINGINYLHQFNICHRDLKPENLLLDTNKNIKIADFGMAALEVREKLLETSCGSPHYASPEIVAGKNYHGAPSDIWSCGIILFALLTGHLPFDDENIRKLLLKVQSGKFVMPPDLSWEAKDLITKMLKVDPNDRITIDLILAHPLLTKYPEPSVTSGSSSSNLDFQNFNVKPIESVDKIDREILKNLSVLFHNCAESEIIAKLISPNKCSEKMFYYLLMKYRNEHTACSSFDDEKNHFNNDDFNDSKISLPRSTSIVKTTVYDQTTGEKHTTIKKVSKSPSTYSNKSLRKAANAKPPSNPNFKVLSNITNTVSPNASVRSFKASTSFNRKKTLLNTQGSRNNSGNVSVKARSSEESKPPKQNPPKQNPPKLTRKLTGLLDLNQLEQVTDKGDTQKVTRKKNMTGTFGNKSLLNFELICDEMFNEEDEPNRKAVGPQIRPDTAKDKSTLAHKERELAAKVHALNEAREHKYKEQELRRRQREMEEAKKIDQERNRQSVLLQEKQRQALEKLRKRQSTNDFADHVSNNTFSRSSRHVTEPVGSSLDPKHSFNVSSLLRAKSLASPSSYASQRFANENTSKVLHRLGIDVVPSPRKLDSHMKTSSSKNLSAYLMDQSIPEFSEVHEDEEDKENVTLDSFNQRERSRNILKPTSASNIANTPYKKTESQNQSPSMAYRSLLRDISETGKSPDFNATIGADETNMTFETIAKNDLIPNPRFSRFSFGGLLSNNRETNEAGDITILNSTLNYSNTVVRKPKQELVAEKNAAFDSTYNKLSSGRLGSLKAGSGMLRKSSTTNLLGLGISQDKDTSRRSSRHRSGQYQRSPTQNSRFVSVDLQESGDEFNATIPAEAISIRESDAEEEEEEDDDDEFGENDSDETMLDETEISQGHEKSINQNTTLNMLEEDYSNFDLISSRTADIGKINTMRPSIVESKETLVLPHSEEQQDDSIKSMYKNYETLYGERRKSKNLIEMNKPNLKPDQHFYRHLSDQTSRYSDEAPIASSSQRKSTSSRKKSTPGTTPRNSVVASSHRESLDKTSVNEVKRKEDFNMSKNFEILDTSSIVEPIVEEEAQPETKPVPRTSTEVFSSRALSSYQKPEAAKVESPVVQPEVKSESLFRKLSLKPKREAPKAPENPLPKTSRFSRISAGLKSPKPEMNESPLPRKNWFKKFISAITSSPSTKTRANLEGDATEINKKSINIIDSSLTSVQLIKVIKTHLELKMIEGSVSQVDIDEEFGLITGIIPAKFSHGRKLKFRIEIIDLINSSSLHLIKIKGNEKGFKSLITIVNFIIKQEEEANNQRKSTGYKFSGYKQ